MDGKTVEKTVEPCTKEVSRRSVPAVEGFGAGSESKEAPRSECSSGRTSPLQPLDRPEHFLGPRSSR